MGSAGPDGRRRVRRAFGALRRRVKVFLRPAGRPDPRDAELARLRKKVRALSRVDLTDDLRPVARDGGVLQTGPSHQAHLAAAWREWRRLRTAGQTEAGRQFDHKLTSYAFAQSHGIAIPRLFGRWDDLDDLDPAALVAAPGRMLKSAYGAAAHGVVPTDEPEAIAEALARWRALAAPTSIHLAPPIIAPPYFTEERLLPEGDVLVDIKVFAFHGVVGQVLLLAAPDFAVRDESTLRVLDAEGNDFGAVVTTKPVDPTIAVPPRLTEVVAAAERLSRALRRPFVRLDFYDLGDRVVLGEITPMPGMTNRYVPAHDRLLGALWEDARARLRSDIDAGLDPQVEWGPHDARLAFADAAVWTPPNGPVHR